MFKTTCKLAILTAIIVMTALPAMAKEIKIAYVNLAYVASKCELTKEHGKNFEKKFQSREKELKEEEASLKKQSEEIRKQSIMLSQDARNKRLTEFEQKTQSLKVKINSFNREAQTAKAKIGREIQTVIAKTIFEYGKKNNYTLILDQRQALYADKAIDISDKILVEVNRQTRKQKKK